MRCRADGRRQAHLANNGVGVGDVFLFLVCSRVLTAEIGTTVSSDTRGLMRWRH